VTPLLGAVHVLRVSACPCRCGTTARRWACSAPRRRNTRAAMRYTPSSSCRCAAAQWQGYCATEVDGPARQGGCAHAALVRMG
jgi:hypothetical protein